MSSEFLLANGSKDEAEFDGASFSLRAERRRRYPGWMKAVCFHVVLIAGYTFMAIAVLGHMAEKYKNGPDFVHSPAQSAVRLERKFINNDVDSQNVFKGKPRPELDDAWRDLFQYNNVRVTKAELDRMNRTSVQLADGSGDYLAALDVYHHLHCVKMIRQYLHPDYYEMPHSVKVQTADHIGMGFWSYQLFTMLKSEDHCLDSLRQELMCRAEVSLTTYDWLPGITIPWAQLSYDHTCANFEAIDEWARSRAIDIFDPKYLVHPELGPSYPNGPPHHR